MSFCKRVISDGKLIALWEDHWIGNSPLKNYFHGLYALELDKQICVATKTLQSGWDTSFRRKSEGGGV